MNRFLNIAILFAPVIFLAAAKERKEDIVKNEERKKELLEKKKAVKKVAPSRNIKIFSHTTSIAVPTIILLLMAYFFCADEQGNYNFPKGFLGNGYLNTFIFSILSSAAGFYFYLYIESFLAKQMPSAIGKFFSGLISFLLSGWVTGCFARLYASKDHWESGWEGLIIVWGVGLFFSLNTSLLSWLIYTGINWIAS